MKPLTLKLLSFLSICLLSAIGHGKGKYNLFIPSNPQAGKAPLMVVLHGCVSLAEDMEKGTRFSEWAEKEGFYVMYPELKNTSSFDKCWNYFDPKEQSVGTGETFSIIQSVEEVKKQYPIDSKKVFVVGMSAGSSEAAILAACYPDQFQGAAFHSGTSYGLVSTVPEALWVVKHGPIPFRLANDSCHPSDFKGKVMIFQGDKDSIVGTKNYKKLINDFLGDTRLSESEEKPSAPKLRYSHQKFWRGNELSGQGIFIRGMNHAWSGGKGDEILTDPNGPDATEMIINYFLKANQ